MCLCPRLAEECASDPVLKENTFTAPSKPRPDQDSLDSLSRCVLRCCDSVWIHTVIVSTRTHTHTHIRFIIYLLVLNPCFIRLLARHMHFVNTKRSSDSSHLLSEKRVTMIAPLVLALPLNDWINKHGATRPLYSLGSWNNIGI